MAAESKGIEVLVRYQGMEVKFSGDINGVIRALLSFLSKVMPPFELASGLTLAVDVGQFLDKLRGIIAFTEEGPVVLIPSGRLGDRDAIKLQLAKARAGFYLGKLEKDSLSIAEILTLTGAKPGTAAGRLSEMVDIGEVERVGRGEYRMTTFGIKKFMEETLPSFKGQMEA